MNKETKIALADDHILLRKGLAGLVKNFGYTVLLECDNGKELIAKLEELITMINQTLNNLTPEQMENEYPIFFDKPKTSVSYVLVQLLAHLNYHLGQVNYLRRILE